MSPQRSRPPKFLHRAAAAGHVRWSSPRARISPTPDRGLVDTDFDAALDRVWRLLDAAVLDRDAALHQPVVATAGADGPDARVMVLRAADRATGTLCFHTDRRAGKVAAIAAAPAIAIIGYDPETRVQLRLYGTATIASDGRDIDDAWAGTSTSGRRAYQTILAPGTAVSRATSGLPPDRGPAEGRANFAVLTIVLDSIEWLHLAHEGHVRARHRRAAGGWLAEWLVP